MPIRTKKMDDWIDYYDSTHTIYVSKLHRDVHFRVIANDILAYVPSPDAVVLDYSCGEAFFAAQVAAACQKLVLAEPAPGVRGRLTARFGPNPKIVVRSLDELAQLPDQSTDLAVMISVAQYMTAAELEGAFALMRRILKPGGQIIIHTAPNRWYDAYAYPIVRQLRRLMGQGAKYPSNPRALNVAINTEVHVNEQDILRMRAFLKRAQFHGIRVWLLSLIHISEPTRPY